jgi:hypothetical protein
MVDPFRLEFEIEMSSFGSCFLSLPAAAPDGPGGSCENPADGSKCCTAQNEL